MHTLGHLLNAIKRTESHFPFQLNFARLHDMFFPSFSAVFALMKYTSEQVDVCCVLLLVRLH